MIRSIALWPDPVLTNPCAPVGEIDAHIRSLCDDLLETMYDAPGRGLAAPQVGVPLRIFVMDATWKDGSPSPRICINPVLADPSDDHGVGPEGCLSIPGVELDVERAAEVTLTWTDVDGNQQTRRLSGFEAICAQHEYDHLDGIVTFDHLTTEVREARQAEYFA